MFLCKGPHGLFKRSSNMELGNQYGKRTFWEHLLKGIDEPIFKRGAYSFGKDITFALYPKIAKKKK